MRHSQYLAPAILDQSALIDYAKETLKGRHYDALVGIGLSGALVVPLLAYVLKKRFCLVRKENVESHATVQLEGNLEKGDRWIFVDDIVASGTTKNYVIAMLPNDFKYCGIFLYTSRTFTTEKR